MSRDCCVILPRGAMGLTAVCVVVVPDHTHFFALVLFLPFNSHRLVSIYEVINNNLHAHFLIGVSDSNYIQLDAYFITRGLLRLLRR